MSTIKSYTDLEQSKKLAEILPIESADMHYERVYFEGKQSDWFVKLGKPIKSDDIIPCWSLAALLDIMPHIQEFYPTVEKINDKFVCRYKGSGVWTNGTNPVDACVEMILKLKEKNLL